MEFGNNEILMLETKKKIASQTHDTKLRTFKELQRAEKNKTRI